MRKVVSIGCRRDRFRQSRNSRPASIRSIAKSSLIETYLVSKTLLLQAEASRLVEGSPLGGSRKDRSPGGESSLHLGSKGGRKTRQLNRD